MKSRSANDDTRAVANYMNSEPEAPEAGEALASGIASGEAAPFAW